MSTRRGAARRTMCARVILDVLGIFQAHCLAPPWPPLIKHAAQSQNFQVTIAQGDIAYWVRNVIPGRRKRGQSGKELCQLGSLGSLLL